MMGGSFILPSNSPADASKNFEWRMLPEGEDCNLNLRVQKDELGPVETCGDF